ncbi:MAG: DUF11 domain-containing protein [Anaerolineales bacterium]|nr:DUF11 domain-containing protein [Anaerolineales bacterium]
MGRTLDRYRIIDHLADDYWGSVYKAYDPKFQRTTAIQILDPQLAANPSPDRRQPQDRLSELIRLDEHFIQLARTLLGWRHSGIARVYDFGQVQLNLEAPGQGEQAAGQPGQVTLTYLVREFMSGGNLRQLLKDLRNQDQWISLWEAVQIIRQVCLALDYAHQRRVEHGDLHPRNIFITQEPIEGLPYQPVLVNLGLVRAGLPALEPSTSAYQSPEMKRGARFEARTDVFSAGVMLYELASGQLPVDAGGKSVVLETGSVLSILPPKILRSELPDELNKIIMRAMALKPNERFESAAEMAEALSQVLPLAEQVKTAPPGFAQAAAGAAAAGSGAALLAAYRNTLKNPVFTEAVPPEVVSMQAPSASDSMPGEALPEAGQDLARLAQAAESPAPVESPASDDGPAWAAVPIQDRLHILETGAGQARGQKIRSLEMRERLTIGRSRDNDVVIDHPSISRHHARIEFDGKNYRVFDLNSTNGTYLENQRLAAGKPQIWPEGENLRLGEIWLRLERKGQSLPTVAAVAEDTRPASMAEQKTQAMLPPVFAKGEDGSPIDPARIALSPDGGQVGALLEQPKLSVAPGESVSARLLLFNRGPQADIFQISIEGIPADWMPNRPQAANVPANGQAEVKLIIKPPRAWQSRAGRHSATLRIASRRAQSEPRQKQEQGSQVELRLELTVAAFSQFNASLRPRQIDSQEPGQVLIENQGNLPETFSLAWEDKATEALRQGGALSFDPPKVRVVIPAGQSAAVEYRAALLQPRWFGGEQGRAFTVHINSQTGQQQTITGEFISRGLIPAWAPVALASLCVMMMCVLFLLFNQISAPSRYAQQTAQAGETSISIAAQETSAAATATVNAFSGSNQSTIQAITATSQWLAADDDQDGLNNSLEVQAGTRPDLADTDEDGLNDGDEVNRWKTNPVIADSDGDGLKDGYEVEKGINPLKKDTDGDGIEDAIDPDPAQGPTQTARPSATLTPSQTLQFTRTRTNTPTITPTTASNIVDLGISINNGQASSIPGTKVTYTIQVNNKGPGIAAGALVSDMFPSNISNLTWTCSASAGSKCLVASGITNINAAVDLAVNGTATFTAIGDLAPSATGLLINTVNVSAPIGLSEVNTVDNLAIDTDTLTPKVALTVTKTDGRSSISPGQSESYTIEVSNSGPSTAPGVGLTDTFPSQLNDMSWTCSATPGSICSVNTQQFGDINTSVSLSPGGKAKIIASGKVKNSATGTLNNTVYVSSTIDPVNNNKSAADSTTIVPQADLLVSVSAPPTATISTPITYTISVTNTGPSSANNLVLSDLLPEFTSFISASPSWPTCTHTAGTVTCNLGALAAEGNVQVVIVVNAPPNPGAITNQVSALSDVNDPAPANNQALTQVQIE